MQSYKKHLEEKTLFRTDRKAWLAFRKRQAFLQYHANRLLQAACDEADMFYRIIQQARQEIEADAVLEADMHAIVSSDFEPYEHVFYIRLTETDRTLLAIFGICDPDDEPTLETIFEHSE